MDYCRKKSSWNNQQALKLATSLVCKLQKALYGLKQAPRAWFDKLTFTLHEFVFRSSKCDSSFFVITTSQHCTYVLVFVDDILITGSSKKVVSLLVKHLNMEFALKDLGDLNYFLGIQVKKI